MRNRPRMPAHHALRCRRGTAATEFALLLPVLVVLFFGVLEASDAMTVNRKVAISGNTLADLTAQSSQLSQADVDNLFTGVLTILEPADVSNVQMNLVSVILDNGNPVVHWSRDDAGAEPYTPGDAFTGLSDETVLPSTGSLVFVEVTFLYTSNLSHLIISSPLTFYRTSIRWPRLSSRVQLCQDVAMTNCTT